MKTIIKILSLVVVLVVSANNFAMASDESQKLIVKEPVIELRVDAAVNQLSIKMDNVDNETFRFDVFDISGKRIKTVASDKLPFDGESYNLSLSEFNSGVYILNVTSKNVKLAKRFMVKR